MHLLLSHVHRVRRMLEVNPEWTEAAAQNDLDAIRDIKLGDMAAWLDDQVRKQDKRPP